MSMSLREKIEGLTRYTVVTERDRFGVAIGARSTVDRAEVLALVEEHERAAVKENLTTAGDSPDFVPCEVAELAGRTFERVNRRGDKFRPGLPAEELRRVWKLYDEEWGSFIIFSDRGTFRWAAWTSLDKDCAIKDCKHWPEWKFRPRGKTWSEVEAMAKAAR